MESLMFCKLSPSAIKNILETQKADIHMIFETVKTQNKVAIIVGYSQSAASKITQKHLQNGSTVIPMSRQRWMSAEEDLYF